MKRPSAPSMGGIDQIGRRFTETLGRADGGAPPRQPSLFNNLKIGRIAPPSEERPLGGIPVR